MARTAQNDSHLAIEDRVQVVESQGGIYSNYPAVFNNWVSSVYAKGTVKALTAAATISLDPTTGTVFTLTPAQNETINAASVPAGEVIYLVVTTSGSSSYTLTFGTNFKSTGTLATGTSSGKVFTVTFVSDGTNFNEVSRTAAQ